MQKTFKKAIACLLAVLMLLCSMPFTAYAANQWWVTDGVDPTTIKETPAYEGYNSATYAYGFAAGDYYNITDDGVEDLRSAYKPVIGVTVSALGSKTNSNAENKALKGTYYGATADYTYDAVKAAGNLVNPAKLVAGQRIAVSVELGGMDSLFGGQFKGTYDTAYLQAGSYSATGAWKVQTTSGAAAAPKDGTAYYPDQVVFGGSNVDPVNGTFLVTLTSKQVTKGDSKASNYIGQDVNSFGKYGIYSQTYTFQVLQDCDLSDVFHFTGNTALTDSGTFFVPYEKTTLSDGAYFCAFNSNADVFAEPFIIWSEYSTERTYSVTIDTVTNGTVTLDGVNAPSGTVKSGIARNQQVTLVATPDAGYKFLGWKANGATTVSTEATFTPYVNADITYTPIFVAENAADKVTVTFVDAFENIVDVKVINKGDSITGADIPTVPARAGYTADGWDSDLKTIMADTTVHPKYIKDTVTNYTVTVPAGSTIAVGTGAAQSVTSVSVPYNTQVTVYNASATSWKINGATVAYGNTYTFYVGADVELTIDTAAVAEETPVVGSVGVEVSGTRVSFLATRKIQTAAGCVQVNAGFIYGTTGVTASTELVDVNGTSVKAVYTKTDSEQYSISFTVTPGSGKTYNGRAFITYKNQTTGEINVAYANLQTYNA